MIHGERHIDEGKLRHAADRRLGIACVKHFIARERDGGAVVATCAFTNIVHGVFQACHLGFSVAAQCQGSGLMHEVASAGIGYMFREHKLHRIMGSHMPRNQRSAALLDRLGFEREGYARAYLRIDGRWEDMVLSALIIPRG